ncbi:hypothetical protein RUM43_002429 [Polyplax serrata]|uniref:Uncharacterized protein n=1 Tax=Polyplax serrata TaxID=468196 RepID=A0AAN8S5Z9_POLSC
MGMSRSRKVFARVKVNMVGPVECGTSSGRSGTILETVKEKASPPSTPCHPEPVEPPPACPIVLASRRKLDGRKKKSFNACKP